MRKLVYSLIVSLDGYMSSADGSDILSIDGELTTFINERSRDVDTEIYGRRMYEVMKFWQTADQDPDAGAEYVEFARIWQAMEKIVVSRTLDAVGPRTRLLREVVPDEIQALKALPGGRISVSGAELAGEFIRLGLVDEYELYVAPVLLGSGTRMFPEAARIDLELLETNRLSTGVIHQHYRAK
jgi:dihydrofolate reductase